MNFTERNSPHVYVYLYIDVVKSVHKNIQLAMSNVNLSMRRLKNRDE